MAAGRGYEGPRGATAREIPAVVALADRVFGEKRPHDMGRWFPVLFHPDNRENLRIVLADGRPVSLVAFTVGDMELSGVRLRAASLGSVVTDAQHRGRGLASVLLADAVKRARACGTQLLLVSGGRGLYRRFGCVDAGLYRTFSVSADRDLPRLEVEVRPWTASDLPAMAALHQAEPVRYLRDRDGMRAQLASGFLHGRPARTWVVRLDGRRVAYFSAQDPRPDMERQAVPVLEMAGSRAAILAAARSLFGAYGTDCVALRCLEGDLEMAALAGEYLIPSRPEGFSGTVKVIDRKGLFAALAGSRRERLGAETDRALRISAGPTVRFRLEGEEFSLEKDEDVAALVFGSREWKTPRVPKPALRSALGRLFPLPLADYGLDYV